MLVERSATLDRLAEVLARSDQRDLSDGIVVVERGKYVGLAAGIELVRAATDVRIDAARQANPLAYLLANAPIGDHIDRLLTSGRCFHACYCDLNNFMPFNDYYGYWLGDRMIKLAASVLNDACDHTMDFLGHVGGDDFLILFQSRDWESRVREVMHRFNALAVKLYKDADIEAGGILGEDRQGNQHFHGFVTIAVGAVPICCKESPESSAIAAYAAAAKREAKRMADGFYVCHLALHCTH